MRRDETNNFGPTLKTVVWGRRRVLFNRAMRLVRRGHMYLGLFLLPWVLLFGISGFLFNHNEQIFGGAVEMVADLRPAVVNDWTGFEAISEEDLAEQVVARINALDGTDGGFRLVPGTAKVQGNFGYSTTVDGETIRASLGLETGRARVTRQRRSKTAESTHPSFHEKEVSIPAINVQALKEYAEGVLKGVGVTAFKPLEPSGGGARMHLVVEDEEGNRWNTSYNFLTGSLGARGSEDESPMNFRSFVTRLHKTHHYPERFGARWVWIAIADLTGLSLVFWGISGMLMWWQIKPTRLIGVLVVSIMTIAAAAIFVGTLRESSFAPSRRSRRPQPATEVGIGQQLTFEKRAKSLEGGGVIGPRERLELRR